MGIDPIGREAYEAYKDLGRYALKNRSELMAQAVADALVSDEPLQLFQFLIGKLKTKTILPISTTKKYCFNSL